jgi:hypothetical protein
MDKIKRTNNDVQNTTQKTKDRATRTPLNTGGELRSSWKDRQFQHHMWHPYIRKPCTRKNVFRTKIAFHQ